MALTWTHFNPASMTDHFELSIMMGTRLMSGSAATRFRKRVMAFSPSLRPSSMLTSRMVDPTVAGELTERLRGALFASGKAAEAIRHARVRIATHRLASDGRQGFDMRPDDLHADGAVQADAEHVEMRHRRPESLDRLGGK